MLLIVLLAISPAWAEGFKEDPSPNPPPNALPDYFGSSSVPKGCRGTENEPYLQDPAFLACRVPFQPGPNLAQSMMDYFKASGVRKISALVACLPQEFRKNFIIAKDSESLQGPCSDAENPRLILFSGDGKQMIGLPGKPDQEGCGKVEVVEYKRDEGRFEPSLIAFQKKDAPLSELPKPLHGKAANCGQCHAGNGGEEWVPKWTAYPTWPGFYGQMDDTFGKGLDKLPLGNDQEKEKYLAFSQGKPAGPGGKPPAMPAAFADEKGEGGKGLYKFLMRPKVPDAEQQKFSPFQTDANAGDSFALRPNTRFNAAIIRANAERIAAKYQAAPGSDTKKYQAAALLLGCPSASKAAGLIVETKKLVPKLQEEGKLLYNRYICREKQQCSGKEIPPCDQVGTKLSAKTSTLFCPDASQADVPATFNLISKDLGMTEQEADSVFLQEVDEYSSRPNYRSMSLGLGGGTDLGKSLTAVALLKELAKKEAPDLRPYLKKGPENPLCTVNREKAKPTKQPRCIAPEMCEQPPLDFVPKAGDPAICEKLRQLGAAAGPKGVVPPGGNGLNGGGAF